MGQPKIVWAMQHAHPRGQECNGGCRREDYGEQARCEPVIEPGSLADRVQEKIAISPLFKVQRAVTPVPDIPVHGNCAQCGQPRVLDEIGGLCRDCQYDYASGTPGLPRAALRRPDQHLPLGYCRACIQDGKGNVPAVTIADSNSACERHAR